MTKIVNSLTARQELGIPMIAIYLLGQPDHYTSDHFINFFWEAYVKVVDKAWSSVDEIEQTMSTSKVLLIKIKDQLWVLPVTHDYIFRGDELKDFCLYDWIARCKQEKVKTTMMSRIFGDATFLDNNSDDLDNDL